MEGDAPEMCTHRRNAGLFLDLREGKETEEQEKRTEKKHCSILFGEHTSDLPSMFSFSARLEPTLSFNIFACEGVKMIHD